MRAVLRLCLIVLAAVATASCATVADTYVVSNKLLSAPADRMGTLVGSIGLSRARPAHQRYSLVAREPTTGEELRFYFKRAGIMDTPADFSDQRAEAALFALQLPEGRYEIRNFEAFSSGILEYRENARREFSIPFEIKAGQATYLGEYIAVPIHAQNFVGAKDFAGTYWEVADRQARDIDLARRRMPSPHLDRVNAAVPDPDRAGVPFFVRPGQTPRLATAN